MMIFHVTKYLIKNMTVGIINEVKQWCQACFVTKNSRSSESICINTSCLFTTRLKL